MMPLYRSLSGGGGSEYTLRMLSDSFPDKSESMGRLGETDYASGWDAAAAFDPGAEAYG